MPKASQSPSKQKKCPVCRVPYHVRGLASHIRKCEREREGRRRLRKYAKDLERAGAPLATPDEPLPCDLDARSEETTPKTAGPSDGPGTYKCRSFSPPPSAEPWCSFFRTREDYEFTKIVMEAGLSDDLIERLIKLIRRCIEGKGPVTFTSYSDVLSARERASASSQLVPVSPGTALKYNY
ncbi:hypothetical protein EDB84DRAFT_422383 [Lactarius hengduanensis]|nr:hypothetical protein EDB84DRAFT_422383 [Lactarius hengduanensis]